MKVSYAKKTDSTVFFGDYHYLLDGTAVGDEAGLAIASILLVFFL